MHQCADCKISLNDDDIYRVRGKEYCEDCAMRRSVTLKKCDVAAVHTAVTSRKAQGLTGTEGLTALQKEIYEFAKASQGATMEQFVEKFGLSPEEIDVQLTVLRHCELGKGEQRADGVYFVIWEA